VAYNATHGLRESRIRFTTIIDHKEMHWEIGPSMRDLSFFI
jgi:hypothetical protein